MTVRTHPGARATGVKVSVVIATYNSPPELDVMVASLDAQTMPKEEYEVIFVDDGSTDSTYDVLQRIAAERANVHVHRIPNSGWPGRPRNVGTRAAVGEFVFFGDHDDYVFPEALERMYEFAAAHRLDVVHPKEVVQGWSSPGWVTWRSQRPRVGPLDQDALQCITPHKLYRRAFLVENDIWFPEGPVRLEDFSFNGLAWARTDAIGVMADYPCYRWVLNDDNSHKKAYDFDVYWKSFRDSLEPLLTELPEGEKRDHLLIRWYRSRILERVAGQFQDYPDDYRTRLTQKFVELLPHFPEHLDHLLTPADRARSVLLRLGDTESMLELSRLDRGNNLDVRRVSKLWKEGALHVEIVAVITNSDGKPFTVHKVGDRIHRRVPARLETAAPPETWDLTDALRHAFGEIAVRSRKDNVDWILDSRSELEVTTQEGSETLQLKIAAEIDPRTAALGEPLSTDVWDVFYRLVGLGYTGTRRIPVKDMEASGALIDGTAVVAFRTRAGSLALDVASGFRSVSVSPRPTIADLSRTRRGSQIALPHVHVSGHTELHGRIAVGGRELPAVLVGENHVARLEVDGVLQGNGEVRTTFLGHTSRPLFTLQVKDPPLSGAGRARDLVRRSVREGSILRAAIDKPLRAGRLLRRLASRCN